MKIILSTSNIMASGHAMIRRPLFSKSNVELIKSLKVNFSNVQDRLMNGGSLNASEANSNSTSSSWTTKDGDTLYVPAWQPTLLAEERDSYDVTVKLFFLPGIPSSRRCKHTQEAIEMVLKELGVNSIDLLIVSYPGVSFDAEDEDEVSGDEEGSANSDESEGLDAQVKTWQVLESLHEAGTIAQLGVSEFSSARLEKFLPEVKIHPSVDQINVKDCCVVPQSLIMYAKEHKIELLTHADCMDILPSGATRELLGSGEAGAGIIAATPDSGDSAPGLKGDIEPQWVVKYTAVVKNRGVIENKGYFAVAQLGSCIE